MQINEACKLSSMTKKAITYYEQQGLISPEIKENGYRDYAASDVETLCQIAVLRALGLSVAQIRVALTGKRSALSDLAHEKQLELADRSERQQLLTELTQGGDWAAIRAKLDVLFRKQSILTRMLALFPGYYGRYFTLHFAPYLGEPIDTPEQQAAFDTVIAFLDEADLAMPEPLAAFLEESQQHMDTASMAAMDAKVKQAVSEPERFFTDNAAHIAAYKAFKASDEYKQTQVYALEQHMKAFTASSGYNDVFIPAMMALSPSYLAYHKELDAANAVFLALEADQT